MRDIQPFDSFLDLELETSSLTLPATGTQTLFTITGGPIVVVAVAATVTTIIQNQACTLQLSVLDTASSTNTAICSATAIANTAAGSTLTINIINGLGLTVNGPVALIASTRSVPIGTIRATTSATNTGAIKYYIRYKKLSPLAVVTPS